MNNIKVVRFNEYDECVQENHSIFRLIHYLFYLQSRGQIGIPSNIQSPMVLEVLMPNRKREFLRISFSDDQTRDFVVQNVLKSPLRPEETPELALAYLFDVLNHLSELHLENSSILTAEELVVALQSLGSANDLRARSYLT